MQLWKLDNTSFSTTQKSGRYKPCVSLVAPLYTYTHFSIREATFSVVLGLAFCSSFPSCK
uniref:Uncharacterized protein n=1 Tax=Medicago truncatula TaxID=3880 RepID=I3SSV4_MEDTR|nr:unknown [Medicago truncatula]